MGLKTLGKYELLEELGRGGFGTVYRARDTTLDVERAVKVLHPALVASPEFIERFRREARIAARLDHPNIVPVYEFGEVRGSFFLVMKYLAGGSLKNVLAREGRLPFERAVKIARQVAEALEYAYSQPEKLIHRDIKPGNILFEAPTMNGHDGAARLADFGFAKALSGDDSSFSSASGGLIGTPPYMPPEIWRHKEFTPATDVYSLACVFFEMISGNVLFHGDSPADIMTMHVLDGPKFPEKWPEGLPEGIENVLRKALARDPKERYPCMGEFVSVLEQTTLRKPAFQEITAEKAITPASIREAPKEEASEEKDPIQPKGDLKNFHPIFRPEAIPASTPRAEIHPPPEEKTDLNKPGAKENLPTPTKETAGETQIPIERTGQAVIRRTDPQLEKGPFHQQDTPARLPNFSQTGSGPDLPGKKKIQKIIPWVIGLVAMAGIGALAIIIWIVVNNLTNHQTLSPDTPTTAAGEVQPPATTSGGIPPICKTDAGGCAVFSLGQTIVIGMGAPMTGNNAVFGEDISRGARFAMTDAGQFNGHSFGLDAQDDGGTPEGGAAVANKFVQNPQVVAVAGHIFSGSSLAAMPIYEAANIPMMSPSASNPALTTKGSTVFNRLVITDAIQGKYAASFLYGPLNITRLAIVHDGQAYGQGLAQLVNDEFTKLGGTVVAFQAITPGESDYSAALADVASNSPQAIFYGGYTAEAGMIVNQMKHAGLSGVTFFGDDGTFGQDFLDRTGANGEGAFSTTLIPPDSEAKARFDAAYLAAYNKPAGTLSPYTWTAYDSAAVLIKAIESVAVESGGKLYIPRTALMAAVRATKDYTGLSGKISCDGTGECAASGPVFDKVQGGKWVPVGK
jgi:branched-chain amino acid transport system substrate-binding protein